MTQAAPGRGLRFKAYLLRERRRGATGNEYAPFFVSDDIDGIRSFSWGEPGYSAIVRDFGRRPSRTGPWSGSPRAVILVEVSTGAADRGAAGLMAYDVLHVSPAA